MHVENPAPNGISEPKEYVRRGRSVAYLTILIVAFALPALGMMLSLIDIKRDDTGIITLLGGASGVAVSDDGRQVYVVAAEDHGLTAFHRHPAAGTLTFIEDRENEMDGVFGLRGATGVTVSPDGRHVYAVSQADDSLVVFARDATAETLTFIADEVQENHVGGVVGLDGASSVAVTADNSQVFATSSVDDALAVFSRDATSDRLTFIEAEFDESGGVSGLDGASAVAISPDNRHVYVTAEVDDSLTVFRRNSNGTVSVKARYQDGVDGIEGLDGAAGVAFSPNGRHVYAVGRISNAVVTFERNLTSGLLTQVDIDRNGVDGVDGLDGAMAVAVSSNGERVFVASRYDNAVAVFRRHVVTGTLELLDLLVDGVDDADGLAGAVSLAVDPEGRFVYVASRDENAVAGLRVALCLGDEDTGDNDRDAVCDDLDVCWGDDFTGDQDRDGVCDDLDLCPGSDDSTDTDGDDIPDGCDACFGDNASGDNDRDGICDDLDVCPGSDDTVDNDGDGTPDGCDLCVGDDTTGDVDGDGICNDLDLCAGDDTSGDDDSDGICNDLDFCFGSNDTGDADGDGICGDLDCDDDDAENICSIFSDGFESGDTSAWN